MSFHALRGAVVDPALAPEVTTPPYDAMTVAGRTQWRRDHPDSWLHVLPVGDVDDHELARCLTALERLRTLAFHPVATPFVAVYQLVRDGISQTGFIADLDVRAFSDGLVHAHEQTRRTREEELARHLDVVRVHSSPVCLMHRRSPQLADVLAEVASRPPRLDLTDDPAMDAATASPSHPVTQRLWVVDDAATVATLLDAADQLTDLVVTDGHHRAAAASRVASLDADGSAHVLVAIFPSDEVTVAAFDRVLSIDPAAHLARLRELVEVEPAGRPHRPTGPGRAVVATRDGWFDVALPVPDNGDRRQSLDVVRLERLLAHAADIVDPRGDDRLSYSAGLGTTPLEAIVADGDHVGWALWPTSVEDVIAIATAGGTLPPKSTYVVPKARSGLLLIPRKRPAQ